MGQKMRTVAVGQALVGAQYIGFYLDGTLLAQAGHMRRCTPKAVVQVTPGVLHRSTIAGQHFNMGMGDNPCYTKYG